MTGHGFITCKACKGSGTVQVLTGGGPDAYLIDSNCPSCDGCGVILDTHCEVRLYINSMLFMRLRKVRVPVELMPPYHAVRIFHLNSEDETLPSSSVLRIEIERK